MKGIVSFETGAACPGRERARGKSIQKWPGVRGDFGLLRMDKKTPGNAGQNPALFYLRGALS